ncbi:hypothetical protein Bca52824_032642 [Brassica carinata]|uniref:Uncharacterized protein n=1 Tax=Brassica carinata TaxID=52824 RepID=A0A8X7V7R4_BRACI|nr:hypothetical protein Bca52824_032642 [Brassica carinata]
MVSARGWWRQIGFLLCQPSGLGFFFCAFYMVVSSVDKAGLRTVLNDGCDGEATTEISGTRFQDYLDLGARSRMAALREAPV